MLFRSAEQLRISCHHRLPDCPVITEFEAQAGGVTVFMMPKVMSRDNGSSRILLRHALAIRYGSDAAAWTFAESGHGQPLLEVSEAVVPCAFSIAAADDQLVVAVTEGGRVGIDMETIDRIAINATFGDRWLSDRERLSLGKVGGDARLAELACHWVLKEAYGKARGIGLQYPLADLTFLDDDGRVSATASSTTERERVSPFAFSLFWHQAFLFGVAHSAT